LTLIQAKARTIGIKGIPPAVKRQVGKNQRQQQKRKQHEEQLEFFPAGPFFPTADGFFAPFIPLSPFPVF
jgi:hypothetical protein